MLYTRITNEMLRLFSERVCFGNSNTLEKAQLALKKNLAERIPWRRKSERL